MDARAAGQGDLGGEVGGAAEAVDAEPPTFGQVGPQQRPIADDARAEQRCGLDVVERIGQRVRVGLVHQRVGGIAAVDVPPGEQRVDAQVLAPAHAEAADAAGVGEPGDSDAVAYLPARHAEARLVDHAHDLMSGRDAPVPWREVALGQMKIRAAHPAGPHFDADLARSGLGDVLLDPGQGTGIDRAGLVDHPCVHERRHRPSA